MRSTGSASVVAAPVGSTPDISELFRLFGAWRPEVRRILDHIDPAHVLRHDLHHLPPLDTYYSGNCVLIGDAAHAMTPDLGQGACQALVDAATLAEVGSPADFDRLRRGPTQRLAAMSLRLNRLSQVRRFLPVRDAVIRLALTLPPPN